MVAVRHHNGIEEDVPPDVARYLLACGHVELAGPLPVETAMLAPVETAMLPAARARKRGRPRKVRD